MEKITAKIAALPDSSNFFSLEFFPPKTSAGFSNLSARLERMSRALRPLFVNVTWGAGGSTASKSLELAELCQKQLNLTTCLHLTCTNMSRKLIDDALEKAKTIGIRNILALRGDPPRNDEYGIDVNGNGNGNTATEEDDAQFVWAIDLVRYIRKKHGDYFCIGVAAYPDGHADEAHPEKQDPEFDLPYLVEKVQAGADFVMTQLFFDVKQYQKFESLLRNHSSGALKTLPIIPGLMPIQSYQIIRRTTKLSHAKMPPEILKRLDAVKGDDEDVKKVGVDIVSEIIEELNKTNTTGRRGYHFYTLNLEKAVSQIVERCNLIPDLEAIDDTEDFVTSPLSGDALSPNPQSLERRRLSAANSTPHNRIIVDKVSAARNQDYEALDKVAGIPDDTLASRKNTLAISEGKGSLGREATWDDFPNGRWGDASSPAFGEIDGYGVSLHVSIPEAIRLWGHPTTVADISSIFQRHVEGSLSAIPWSEEDVSPETSTIKEQLVKLNGKGFWTVASQPAVNGVASSHKVLGWGPRNGFVFQKPFVEFFLSESDWKDLREKLDKHPEVTYFAGDNSGKFEATEGDVVNPVTWGTFPGKEIITPTIIEPVSFKAWRDEAFSIWREWQRIYPPTSATARLLRTVRETYWLVNLVHHEFVDADALWNLLLD